MLIALDDAPDAIAQTTPAPQAMARAVEAAYDLGPVVACELLRRSFNQVYGLRFASGQRAAVRLCADRPRGAPDLAYETALLRHLRAAAIPVAAALPTRTGSHWVNLQLPEGVRPLVVFEHLDGESPGESLHDIAATGRGLALLHAASSSYAGPVCRYTLDLPHLLDGALQQMLASPALNDTLRMQFAALARELHERIDALRPGLTKVHGHGDCHGGNNFMTDAPDGTRQASFFDFDDAAPGLLAYELCIFLWNHLPRSAATPASAAVQERCASYLSGYESVTPLSEADKAAIGPCLAVRQFWIMGETAGRATTWGTQTLPTAWMHKQLPLLREWMDRTPPA
jgi:Ser/Thr protein kinase RdoA (MazF antagonist)